MSDAEWFMAVAVDPPREVLAIARREEIAASLVRRAEALGRGAHDEVSPTMLYGGGVPVTWHALDLDRDQAVVLRQDAVEAARETIVRWALRNHRKAPELDRAFQILDRAKVAEAAVREPPSTQPTPALPPSPA